MNICNNVAWHTFFVLLYWVREYLRIQGWAGISERKFGVRGGSLGEPYTANEPETDLDNFGEVGRCKNYHGVYWSCFYDYFFKVREVGRGGPQN